MLHLLQLSQSAISKRRNKKPLRLYRTNEKSIPRESIALRRPGGAPVMTQPMHCNCYVIPPPPAPLNPLLHLIESVTLFHFSLSPNHLILTSGGDKQPPPVHLERASAALMIHFSTGSWFPLPYKMTDVREQRYTFKTSHV